MVSRVIYRPFDEDDFNAIAAILQAAWHTDTPTPGYAFLEACADLAHSLSISTFSQVALIDGEPRGISLARGTNLSVPVSSRWKRAEDDFLEQMRLDEPVACERYLEMLRLMNEIDTEMLKESELPEANEITLLAVDENARGLGIGSVLLDAAVSYLSSRGAAHAFLYTDTDCGWQFYESQGFTRAASHHVHREQRSLLPREMYVYTLDLSE